MWGMARAMVDNDDDNDNSDGDVDNESQDKVEEGDQEEDDYDDADDDFSYALSSLCQVLLSYGHFYQICLTLRKPFG